MFPFEQEEVIEEEETIEYYPREYDIDFSTGKLTGKIVEGSKAIAIWVYLAMQIDRYKFYTYSWDYGNELKNLIGKNYSKEYINSEIERMIKDCVEENPYVNGIQNLEIEKIENTISISFEILTDYGVEEVKIDV